MNNIPRQFANGSSHLKKGLFSNQMVLSRDFASLMCVVLDKYQISQTESNAGMQTDNNVFIRLSTGFRL